MTSTTVRQLTCQSAVNIRWCRRRCLLLLLWEIFSPVSGPTMNEHISTVFCCGLLLYVWWLLLVVSSKLRYVSFLSVAKAKVIELAHSRILYSSHQPCSIYTGLGTDNMKRVAEFNRKTMVFNFILSTHNFHDFDQLFFSLFHKKKLSPEWWTHK